MNLKTENILLQIRVAELESNCRILTMQKDFWKNEHNKMCKELYNITG